MSTPMDALGAVLVGVDGSDDGMQAVTWGAHEAVRTGATLRIVHASPWSLLAEQPGRCDSAWDEQELGLRARRILGAAASHARDVEPGLSIEAELVCGDGPVGVARAAAGAAVVAIGRRGLGTTGTRWVGGGVAVMAEQVHAVVAVCGSDSLHSHLGGQEGPVVVGIDTPAKADGSLDQHRVIEHAFALARHTTGQLRIIHAWHDADWGALDPVSAYLKDWPTAAKDAEVNLNDLLGQWYDRYPDVSTVVTVVDSRPARELIAASAGAGAVVIGARGRASLQGTRFGPVARRVTSGAACPVIVVPVAGS